MIESQKALQAILTAVNLTGPDRKMPPPPVVCLSRDIGSGGDEIAEAVANRLGVPLYDRAILESIAARLKADPHILTALEGGVARWRDLWLFGAVGTGSKLMDDYRRHLIDVVTGICASGGVILGRGAHLVLARSNALKVRIAGSAHVCAERLAAHDGIGVEEAKRRIVEGNRQRDQFLEDSFGARANDCTAFDLVICTDRLRDIDRIAELIVTAEKQVRPAAK